MTELPTDKNVLVKLDEGLQLRIEHERQYRRRARAEAERDAGGEGSLRPLPTTRVIRELLIVALDACAAERGEEGIRVERVAVGDEGPSFGERGLPLVSETPAPVGVEVSIEMVGEITPTGTINLARSKISEPAAAPVAPAEPEEPPRAEVKDSGGAGWVGANVRALGVVEKKGGGESKGG